MENTQPQRIEVTTKVWIVIIFMLTIARMAWSIENIWFTSFVYAEVAYDVNITSWMIAVSAVLSCIATLVFGTISDRKGKRKPFILWGFILWGIFTFLFSLGAPISTQSIVAAGIFCIVMDGIMSFTGSIASDAGFSAWTTDITDKTNRGTLGSIFAVIMMLANVLVAVIAGLVVDRLGYIWLFAIIGSIVLISGILSRVLVKESPMLHPNIQGSFGKQLLSVFKFKSLQENKALLMVLIAYAYFYIVLDAIIPYVAVYFINYLGLSATEAGIAQAIGTLMCIAVVYPFAKAINKGKQAIVLIIAGIAAAAGLIVVGLAAQFSAFITATVGFGLVVIAIVAIETTCIAWMKNLYPEQARGQYEGLRMLFYVALPMVLGSILGNILITNFGAKEEGGVIINDVVLYICAGLSLLSIIPGLIADKWTKQSELISKVKEITA